MISLYCTADTIGTETGGGIVTTNELNALEAVSDNTTVLARQQIGPSRFGQPDSPFLYDYFALAQIGGKHFDLAHFYSGTFTQTIRWLKSQGTKVSYTVAAHDRKISMEEFARLGLEYPFRHVSDDELWDIFTEGIRLADVVIAPSTISAECLKSQGCRNVVVIPHGINLPKKVEPVPQNFDVAYLGATGPDKGLIYLIEAWGMLNYADSRLILAGAGTETLEPFIRHITDKGNFVLLGRVPDVADVYNACSIYVQPSVCEGFGIEVAEAMSYGRPVIASEGAGASDLIDGDNGFIVPIRNAKAIAEQIEWFKSNQDKIAEMGQRARSKARNYTWDKIREGYVQLFSAL